MCRAWRLTGGVSAEVHALELEDPEGRRQTVVVRQIGAAQWKSAHAHPAAMEHDLLKHLHHIGVPVPQPLLFDPTGKLLPRPFLVSAYVEGSTGVAAADQDTCIDTMAATLAHLHALPVDGLPELPQRTDPLPELFDYLPDIPQWRPLREHLSRWMDSAYEGPPSLLHGDFWPGNLLWQRGHLTAILDWEDAALGDPLSDVAACRLELSYRYEQAAVDRFTRAYARTRPLDTRRLALWTVYVASAASHFMGEWGLDTSIEARMRSKAIAAIEDAARTLLGLTCLCDPRT